MAVERLAFGAHDGDAVLLHSRQESLDARTEGGCLGQLGVTHAAVLVVARLVLAAGAQLFAQEHVADSGGCQGGLQLFFVELGIEAAVRR